MGKVRWEGNGEWKIEKGECTYSTASRRDLRDGFGEHRWDNREG